MTILLTNDDGIDSPGLAAARRALAQLGEVEVVAPLGARSCAGKSITIGRTLRVVEAKTLDGTPAQAVDGTPADAVMIALSALLKRKPKLLASGINLGPNMGLDDVLDSGTLGAAFEAAMRGIPSIAASYCTDGREPVEEGLREAGEVLRRVAEFVLKEGMPKGVDVISINVPQGFKLGSSPMRLTRISAKPRRSPYVRVEGGYAIKSWGLDLYPADGEDTDVGAVRRGFLSITPISLRLPARRRGCEGLLRAIQG